MILAYILLSYSNEHVISSINVSLDDIAKVIQKLDPNKAHGHMISICMLKICGNSLDKPLQLIFQSCIENGKFPSELKKANVLLVHKKGNKQLSRITVLYLCFQFVIRFLNV